MTFEQLQAHIEDWAEARGIYAYSTQEAQLLKAVSELGELADAQIKSDWDAVADGIGDVLVCLINYAAMRNVNIVDCLNGAWLEIKDRKGRMVPGGAFVKE